jgi:SEL1 protein
VSASLATERDHRTNGPLRRPVAELHAAADQQHPDAIYMLADMNFFGNYSHPRNFTEAFRRYNQLAVLNGNASAQHMLAFMYSTGIGGAVKPDQARAMLYYTAAAHQDNERSQMALAYRHHVGISTPRNCQAAVRLYKKVAERAIDFVRSGPPSERTLIKQAYRISDDEGGIYGEGASASSSGQNSRPKPVNSDAYATFEDVLEYLDLISKKGDLKATFQLGRYHYEGSKGLKPNFKLSYKYFLEVYQQHENKLGKGRKENSNEEKLAYRSVGYLGRMALRGDGMEQNFRRARAWLNMGVAGGDAQSQYFLGLMYLDGLGGVEKKPKRAAELFTASADQDYAPAQVRLAVLFLDVGDSQTALRYLELAARHGHMEALYYLAELSWTGTGRDASCDLAAHYFKSVSEKADIVDSSIQEANLAHELGDLDLAVIDYMLAAEQGFESAQTNVAFLLDRVGANPRLAALRTRLYDMLSMVPQRITLPPSPGTGLMYWTHSARQLNVDSLVKMGDYYLVGRDDTAVDSDKAAACYGAAAETLQSAQALWNLGWMHENGVGGLEQDFHLAKRFYDQALEINTEAYLAVVLALTKLRLRSRWNQWTRGGIKSIVEDDGRPSSKRRAFEIANASQPPGPSRARSAPGSPPSSRPTPPCTATARCSTTTAPPTPRTGPTTTAAAARCGRPSTATGARSSSSPTRSCGTRRSAACSRAPSS